MNARIAKATALRAVRSAARKSGFSETRYEVRARARAGRCELWLRRKVGPQPGDGHSERAAQMLIGSGPRWSAAVTTSTRFLRAMGEVTR